MVGTAAFASLGLLLAGTLRAEATLAAANLVYLLLLAGGAVVLPRSSYGGFGDVLRLLPSGALGDALRDGVHRRVGWRCCLSSSSSAGPSSARHWPPGSSSGSETWLDLRHGLDNRERALDHQKVVGRLAVANLVANIAIVVTGGAVRLTGSGLGCPTWPQCTDESYVPHGSLGLHGAIEFGNRTLTFVLAMIAIACFLAALRSGDRRAIRLSAIIGLGIPAQAVIGGITVLTDLNPWIVAFHFLVSMAMIGICVVLVQAVLRPDGSPTHDSAAPASAAVSCSSPGWSSSPAGWCCTSARS